jgi:hypothetical protein
LTILDTEKLQNDAFVKERNNNEKSGFNPRHSQAFSHHCSIGC